MNDVKQKKSPATLPDKSDVTVDKLFTEVARILEEARRQTVRSVNKHMVAAYWLVGWRIVESEQGGRARAGYGERLLDKLSVKLTERFGKGYSVANLRNFREFYLTYPDRLAQIRYALFDGSDGAIQKGRSLKRYPAGSVFEDEEPQEIQYPVGSEFNAVFHPNLGWSHYRALMRVENPNARLFYEGEASKAQWSKRDLERQIGSLYYERLLMSRDKRGMLAGNRRKGSGAQPIEIIKDPYVLEFLNLPETHSLNETALEERLISHLQEFLLELGDGFAFIGRQKRLTLDGDHFYADLVFYHVRLKCYIVIDLKTGRLSHGDLGQMQLYVNYFDLEVAGKGDNPTLGLILCTSKNDAVVHYVLGKNREKIFASRYRMVLPTEEELAAEVRREMKALGIGGEKRAQTQPMQERKSDAPRRKTTRKGRP